LVRKIQKLQKQVKVSFLLVKKGVLVLVFR
jgi:hypothetical protein